MEANLYVMLFTPLFSAVLIAMFMRKSTIAPMVVSCFSAFAALAAGLALMLSNSLGQTQNFELFTLGDFSLKVGCLLDSLGANMMFVVCFVGFLIHIFSVGYMDTDNAKGRFFAGLSFFMFSMTGLVLSSNLFMMFVFWELVGFSSYALIAHYADTPAAREASKKAFITNRVGDFGFLLGIVFCQSVFGTTDFSELAKLVSADPTRVSTLMGMLLLCGFLGKSAQFPLQVWLPDAMAGPTPVSALIHAATMVAAGVFMMVRLASFGFLTPEVLNVVLILCSAMAFCAGLWALGQTDIKKILAYSTLAHLGLMGAGVALSYDLAMFHLTTHAFFKATLFLAAGSVIHACHHEQDIYKMGGLFKKMPLTSIAALLATLSIVAIPYFSGCFSKEAIVLAAFKGAQSGGIINQIGFAFIFGAAVLTPIYMFRLFFNVFFGKSQSENASHAHESSLFMTIPLIILGIYSVCGGWAFVYDMKWIDGRLDVLIPSTACEYVGGLLSTTMHSLHSTCGAAMLEHISLGITLAGIVFTYFFYGRSKGYDPIQKHLPILYRAFEAHGWFDNIYNWYIAKVQQRIATFLNVCVDLLLIEFLCVRGVGVVSAVIGYGVKKMHTVSCNSQVRWMVFGALLILILIFA